MTTGLKADDIMTPHVVTTTPNQTIVEAADIMNKFRIGGLPVIATGNKLKGIITERIIMKHVIAANKKPGEVKVKDIMIPLKDLVTGEEKDDVEEIAKKMFKYDISRVPIVKKGKLMGIVTNKDVIEHSQDMISLLMEQARIKGPFDALKAGPVAFGKCEGCGQAGDLTLIQNKFLCDECK